MLTQYGDAAHRPEPADVVNYLRWCRDWERTQRPCSCAVGRVRTMRSALVLNASFEPLSVVSAQRATCLVLAEKAELVEGDGHVHPLGVAHACPARR